VIGRICRSEEGDGKMKMRKERVFVRPDAGIAKKKEKTPARVSS
jgi:hypothetical protein